jgi:hypothetical protein
MQHHKAFYHRFISLSLISEQPSTDTGQISEGLSFFGLKSLSIRNLLFHIEKQRNPGN